MNKIEHHRNALKLLVLIHLADFILFGIFAATLSYPDEIEAAEVVMAELAPEPSTLLLGIGFCLLLLCFVFYVWSLWELYRLNEKGFTKFFWSYVGFELSSFCLGGSWSSPVWGLVTNFQYLSAGAILYIGYLCSEVASDLESKGQTGMPAPMQGQSSPIGQDGMPAPMQGRHKSSSD